MKKKNMSSRAAPRRRSSRAARRRAAAEARVKIRMPSASAVPWNESTDNCQHIMAAESYSEQIAPGAVDPLDALDADFRKSLGWRKPPGAEPELWINTSILLRRPAPEFVAGTEFRFVAIDPNNYNGDAIRDRASHQAFWDHQINGRPFSMPFVKSGIAIWKKLALRVSTETTAYMMQMNSVDAETSDAIHAAVWSTFNTARYPVDVESLVFALATFIHADPLRQHLVSSEPYLKPYGNRTEYALRKVYGALAAVDKKGGPTDDE